MLLKLVTTRYRDYTTITCSLDHYIPHILLVKQREWLQCVPTSNNLLSLAVTMTMLSVCQSVLLSHLLCNTASTCMWVSVCVMCAVLTLDVNSVLGSTMSIKCRNLPEKVLWEKQREEENERRKGELTWRERKREKSQHEIKKSCIY